MPNADIKKIHLQKGIPIKKLEHLWSMAETKSKDAGHEDNYAYVMGIFKTMIRENTSTEQLSLFSIIRNW
jgi:hypothetical protein